MITRRQALTVDRFHQSDERRTDGTCYVWRRNGATKTWSTRPADFRIPVKYGLRGYGYIDTNNASGFHAEADCPDGNR